MSVKIGNNILFGPNVQIHTATHSMDHRDRKEWLKSAKPLTIGDDCWFGSGVIICLGVTIGSRTVIGAGSVITKDIESDVFTAEYLCMKKIILEIFI